VLREIASQKTCLINNPPTLFSRRSNYEGSKASAGATIFSFRVKGMRSKRPSGHLFFKLFLFPEAVTQKLF
jgi:hypothetical protein